MIKTIVTSIVTTIIVAGLMLTGLVGNQSDGESVGSANTRFPNGLNIDSPSNATSSLTLGKVCYTFESTSGTTTYYGYYKDAGALATSTTNCN